MTVTKELKGGHLLLVDDEDAPLLDLYPWRAMPIDDRFYVSASVWMSDQTNGTLLLHRLVMNAPDGMDVDHKNHNGLDNRRSNLRVCTRAQNLANTRPGRNNTSGYKGVSWSKQHRKWAAYIKINYKRRHLGLFMEKRDAATAYNTAAYEAWGEFAYLNDVNEIRIKEKEQG